MRLVYWAAATEDRRCLRDSAARPHRGVCGLCDGRPDFGRFIVSQIAACRVGCNTRLRRVWIETGGSVCSQRHNSFGVALVNPSWQI